MLGAGSARACLRNIEVVIQKIVFLIRDDRFDLKFPFRSGKQEYRDFHGIQVKVPAQRICQFFMRRRQCGCGLVQFAVLMITDGMEYGSPSLGVAVGADVVIVYLAVEDAVGIAVFFEDLVQRQL